jgi:hypothetical protein
MIRIGKFSVSRKLLPLCFLILTSISICPPVVLGQGVHPGGLSGKSGVLANWFQPEGSNCPGFNCDIATITARRGANPVTETGAGSVQHVDNSMNFNPSITLNNGRMTFPRSTSPNFRSDLSAVFVFSTSSPTPSQSDWRLEPAILGPADIPPGDDDVFGVGMVNGEIGWGDDNTSAAYRRVSATGGAYDNGIPHIVVVNRRNCPGPGCNATDCELFIDGVSIGRNNSEDQNLQEYDTLYLGHSRARPATAFFNGKVGDVVLFADTLSPVERRRIETYFALKYGLTLITDYQRLGGPLGTGPIYHLDLVHDLEIVGVGRCDSSRLNQRLSAPATDPFGFAVMYGTGFAGTYPPQNDSVTGVVIPNNTYVITGHDAGAPTFTKAMGSILNCKLARTFKVSDVGAPGVGAGPVTLYFDDAKYNLNPLATYYVAISRDAGIGIGEKFVALVPDGNVGHYAEVDFPDNDTTYFTITDRNTFSGPAAVVKGLELWLRSDTGIVGPTGAFTAWRDKSGNEHDISTGAVPGIWAGTPVSINYHADIKVGALDRNWRTNPFRGQTIIGVGKVSGGAQWDGYLGFNGDKGLRKVTAPADNNLGISNVDDWTNGVAGGLRQNGTGVTSASLTDYCVILGEKSSLYAKERFYAGGYFAGRAFNSYDFAEILVYDTVLTLTEKERIESYLGLKYGLNLTHDYTSSLGTTYYTIAGGYGFEIAGIGRDDDGRLLQKQSISSSPSAVVSLALGSHQVYDTLNANVFEADHKFLVAGHNGNSDLCWSDLDLRIAGEEGMHYRVPREWKATKTGVWSSDMVQFTVNVNVAGYNIPALPPAATNYYLYVDNNGNFTDGGTNKFQMTLLTPPNVWAATVNPAAFGANFFFTFGAQLDTLNYGKDTVCKGGPFQVHGSRLGDVCTALTLINGPLQHNAIQGALGNTSFAVTVNAANTCLDTLTWQAPTGALAGNYRLLVDTMAGAAGCPLATFPTFTNRKGALLRQIRVDTGEVADITWPGDSIYCENDPNIQAIIGPTTSPGVFSYFFGPNSLNPGSVLGNTSTGAILIHPGSVGAHTIRYVTTGGSSCKDTADVVLQILQNQTPTVVYNPDTICGGGPFSAPPTVTGRPTNGRFSASPGLAVDSITGVINLQNSIPGTYTVYYTPDADSCGNVETDTVVIGSPERAYFNYIDSVICEGAGPELPLIQYHPATGGFGLGAGSPSTNLFINSNTGAIDLDSTTAGVYYIAYSGIVATCTLNVVDTVRVKAPTDASFTMPNGGSVDTLCLSDLPFIPTRVDPNGYFTTLAPIDILPDSLTINPPGSTAGGPYVLNYIVEDTFCSDTVSGTLFFRGVAAASISYSDSVVCENEANPYPIFANGVTGGSFLTGAGPVVVFVDSLTGEVDISAMTTGVTYTIEYAAPDPACPDTFPVSTLVIDPIPNPFFDLVVDSLCEQSGTYPVDSVSPTGTPSLSIFNGGNAFPGAFTGTTLNINALVPGGPYQIVNVQTLGACQDTAYDYIIIKELDTADIEFVPAPFVICIGDNDPYPFNYGDPGGIFSLSSTAPFAVNVDSLDGTMTLDTSMALGIYWVLYTTQGFCPAVDSSAVDVRNDISAQFDYPSIEICQTDTPFVGPTLGFATPGVFRADPNTIVWQDSINGIVNVAASPNDTFSITYTISSAGSCTSQYTDRLVIVRRDSFTTITYNGDPYCPSDANPTPVVLGSDYDDGIFSAPGLFFANVDSGIIALASTPADTYLVTFQKTTVCAETFTDSIVVKPAANAYFSYLEPVYCISPTNPLPDSITTAGGVFSSIPDSSHHSLDVDFNTGLINLFNSTPGNYFVTYSITNTATCDGFHQTEIRVLPQPTNVDLLTSVDSDSICEGRYVEFKATGADLVTWELNGVPQPASGTFYDGIGLDSGDVVTAIFNTLEGCTDRRSRTMHVFPIPSAQIQPAPAILAGNDAISIEVLLLSDATYLEWHVTGIGDIDFDSTDGYSAMGDSSDIIPLGNTVFLGSEINPAQFTYLVVPHTEICAGPLDTVTIKVNPNGLDIFVPQVMTPDGNFLNDTWLIQWKTDVDPNAFTMLLFNSAGALVHTMTPIHSQFNGVGDAGFLPDGVYWYLLLDNTGAKKDAGGLTIRRK